MRSLLLAAVASITLVSSAAHAEGLLPDQLKFSIGFHEPREHRATKRGVAWLSRHDSKRNANTSD